eukprot:scaffold1320_cov113-Isochrysis_galbana.AAC.3
MGDARKYPEIRASRFQYAMLFLPKKIRADYELRQQWIDNNLTYYTTSTSTPSYSSCTSKRTTTT